MKNTIKNILIVVLSLSLVGGFILAGGGDYQKSSSYFNRSGGALILVNSADTLGNTNNRIPNIYLDAMNVTTMTISGASADDLDMGGYAITNAGTITGTNFVATSTSVSSSFLYRVGIGTTTPSDILHLVGNNAGVRLEDDNGNYARIKVGESQLTLEADPANVIASTDIVFKIDGVEVGRFEQGKGFQSKKGFATELWNVSGGNFETATTGAEYYSPDQQGGIYGTTYRQYFNTVLTSTNPRLDTGSIVTKMVDFVLHTKYTSNDRGVGHGNMTAYGSSDDHAYIMLSGASGSGNLSFALAGYSVITGWVDYTK
ncbi:hypothetical protein LCGC14_2580090 [marine sediment metagenome]|uniref:Uncharacterized protein n=1 Tax=marine sediment metagenome TaxID=412755 RepID=A0A0F9AEL4_9ZZZZ